MLSELDNVKAFVDKGVQVNVIQYMGVCVVHSKSKYQIRHMSAERMQQTKARQRRSACLRTMS
jgi:hypothetical protein